MRDGASSHRVEKVQERRREILPFFRTNRIVLVMILMPTLSPNFGRRGGGGDLETLSTATVQLPKQVNSTWYNFNLA